jgi:hypothetical protein
MTRPANVLWAAHGDRTTALLGMKIGSHAAAIGAVVTFGLITLRVFRSNSGFSGELIVGAGALLLAFTALAMYRGRRAFAPIALVIWFALGVVPSEIPLWLGVAIAVCIVAAVRAAHVLNHADKSGVSAA